MPVWRKPHSPSVHIWVLFEKVFEFLLEGMVWVYGVEQVDYHREDIIHATVSDISVCKPRILHSTGKKRLNLQQFVPKSRMMGAEVANIHQCVHPGDKSNI